MTVRKDGIEVDSDVNEDQNREQQLDQSFSYFLNINENIKKIVHDKEEMTQVPKASVFDSAVESDQD